LLELLEGVSSGVQREALDWYRVAKATEWANLSEVRRQFPDADLVDGMLVFNIRQNRYRLIVFPKFIFRTLYIKALLTHKEYTRGGWKTDGPNSNQFRKIWQTHGKNATSGN
jgi:mRNA interferase HigB